MLPLLKILTYYLSTRDFQIFRYKTLVTAPKNIQIKNLHGFGGRTNIFDTATITPNGEHVRGVGAFTGIRLFSASSIMSIFLMHEHNSKIFLYCSIGHERPKKFQRHFG